MNFTPTYFVRGTGNPCAAIQCDCHLLIFANCAKNWYLTLDGSIQNGIETEQNCETNFSPWFKGFTLDHYARMIVYILVYRIPVGGVLLVLMSAVFSNITANVVS